MKKHKQLPDFRMNALEEKYIEHFTKICDLFRDYGRLQGFYDIRQMLTILKTEDWREVPPLFFYLDPLQRALDKVEAILLHMHKLGVLRIEYIIENNKELEDAIIHMVDMDNIAQWLAGDKLKQDQLIFIYDMHKKIARSALKDYYLNLDRKVDNTRIISDTIPRLTVFKAMLSIRDIDDRKEADRLKEIEKQARKEALGLIPEPEEEVKEEEVKKTKATGGKKKKVVEPDPEELERIRKKAEFEKELAKYGRTWIWEGYYNDTEHHQNWLDGAERLRHVNVQVLEDIEDWILLDGFQEMPDIRNWPGDIEGKV